MISGFWPILLLTAVVAILQVIHLALLNNLDAIRLQKNKVLRVAKTSVSPDTEIKAIFSIIDDSLRNQHVLDSTGVYRISTIQLGAKHHTFSAPTSDVTLVTQCSIDHISKLLPLTKRWQGLISVAVFLEEPLMAEALWEIAQMLTCYPSIKNNVTFSLVTPVPAKNEPVAILPDYNNVCEPLEEEPTLNYSSNDQYPNNLLRNVARRASSSEFIFVIDIDMMPNENLRQDFILLATQRGLFRKSHFYDKTIFVVPSFEAKENVEPPLNKAQLLSLIETGEIRPFYSQICSKCQASTNYDSWLSEPPGTELASLFDVLWKDPWEPFYIASNNVPLYDERFKQYGFNRISQVCELHVAGYTFSVLNNAFIIHKGFKTLSSFHERKSSDQENNRLLFRQFKTELRYKYIGSRRKCY